MELAEESLDTSPLFIALTRPPMVFGVTLDYMAIAGLFSLCGFILFNSALCLVIYFPLHIIGMIGCYIDHNIFRLVSKLLFCGPAKNSRIWGCKSYEPF